MFFLFCRIWWRLCSTRRLTLRYSWNLNTTYQTVWIHCVSRSTKLISCCAVLCCDAMRCNAMRCDVMRCNAMRCDVMRCDVMWCEILRCIVLYLASPQGQGNCNCVCRLLWVSTAKPMLSTFPVGGNRSTWRKPTTFDRALTHPIHNMTGFESYRKDLTEYRTQGLTGESQVV